MKETRHRNLDFDELLHPAQAFGHPSEVATDPDLTLNEKRAILASWASDACALEACPELRELPSGAHVRFDEIMDALRALDREASHWLPAHRRAQRKTRLRGLTRWRVPDRGRSLQ